MSAYQAARLVVGAIAVGLLSISSIAQVDGFSVEPDTIAYGEPLNPDAPKTNLFEGQPGKTALFGLVAPGAGQIYNGSYWKAPVVWGVIGGVGAVMAFNIDQYHEFDTRYTEALLAEMAGEPSPDLEGLSSSQLFTLRTQANKNRQLSIVIFSFAWLGQAVEAYVDAHLKDFDISDDLSIRFQPVKAVEGPVYAGVGMTINFRTR